MNRDGSKGAGVLMEDVRDTRTSSEKAGSDLEVPAKAKRRRFTGVQATGTGGSRRVSGAG